MQKKTLQILIDGSTTAVVPYINPKQMHCYINTATIKDKTISTEYRPVDLCSTWVWSWVRIKRRAWMTDLGGPVTMMERLWSLAMLISMVQPVFCITSLAICNCRVSPNDSFICRYFRSSTGTLKTCTAQGPW